MEQRDAFGRTFAADGQIEHGAAAEGPPRREESA